jgi:hypothetical protein
MFIPSDKQNTFLPRYLYVQLFSKVTDGAIIFLDGNDALKPVENYG